MRAPKRYRRCFPRRDQSPLIEPPFMAELQHSALVANWHVMLTGPAGTGKTFAVMYLARISGQQLEIVQGHCDMTVEELRGMPTLEDGSSGFQDGLVTRAVRNRRWILFDEVHLCRPGVSAWLNNVLTPDGLISIPETGEQLAVPPNFKAFFCWNPGYAGSRPLNEAFMDRCRMIECDYWPPEKEQMLIHAHVAGLATADTASIVRVANAVRKAREEGEIDFDWSMRTSIQLGMDTCQRTQDPLESIKSIVLPKVGDRRTAATQREVIWQLANLFLK